MNTPQPHKDKIPAREPGSPLEGVAAPHPEEYGAEPSMRDAHALPRAKKRIFVGLICCTALSLCLLVGFGWFVPFMGFSKIHPTLPWVTGVLLGLLILFIAWIAMALVFQVIAGRPSRQAGKTWGITVKIFLPLLELVGRLAGITPLEVRRSFIQVNNRLVHNGKERYRPAEVLILLPHCLQWSGCNLRVSSQLERCRRCGQCDIAALLDLGDRYGVHIAIATGGTIARRIVVEKKPRLILAVACERDLTSGIQDTFPLPVYGILNERPHGPCLDTRVPLPQVEQSLRHFIRTDCLTLNSKAMAGSRLMQNQDK